jgi:5-methylcytosine-specific restriction protein A
MITPYKEKDETIWIPVAKGKSGGAARAFLPFNGLKGNYRFGYKAAPSTDHYIEALSQIQQSFVTDENQLFKVNNGKKDERQWRARWRHGNESGSPLLGPTLGWVMVSLSDVGIVSSSDLELALKVAESKFVKFTPVFVEPVLCETPENLEREAVRLFRESYHGVPAGQVSPKRSRHSTEAFIRDAQVVAFVLRKAIGICECCNKPAPFEKPNGLPYLEVHHVKRLASGGSDRVENAVALCPNCHRELHHGAKSIELVEQLYQKIDRLIRE